MENESNFLLATVEMLLESQMTQSSRQDLLNIKAYLQNGGTVTEEFVAYLDNVTQLIDKEIDTANILSTMNQSTVLSEKEQIAGEALMELGEQSPSSSPTISKSTPLTDDDKKAIEILNSMLADQF